MRTVDLVPVQGSTQDLLERLRAYVGQTDPDWAGKLAPASDAGLERLCELAGLNALGLSLPESYRVWALVAGAADGGLLSGSLRAWVTVEDMIDGGDVILSSDDHAHEYAEPLAHLNGERFEAVRVAAGDGLRQLSLCFSDGYKLHLTADVETYGLHEDLVVFFEADGVTLCFNPNMGVYAEPSPEPKP